jgi:hypothetical protein
VTNEALVGEGAIMGIIEANQREARRQMGHGSMPR